MRPLVPEIGIVTLVQRKWYAPWSTQQHLMNRLARYFPIAWIDPPLGWREALAALTRRHERRSLADAPPEGLLIHDPAWLPITDYFHINCHYQALIDIQLDQTHSPFVHPDTLGNAAKLRIKPKGYGP